MIDIEQTIISQYGNSATITTLIQNFNECVDPRADIDNFYDFVWNVETAEGFGLDIWGRIVGVDRAINVPDDTPNPGMLPFTPGVYEMDDDQYRTVILFKALANISDSTANSLNTMLTNLFSARGRCYVRDTGDMTMQFTFEFWLYPFEYVIITESDITPRPAGVLAKVFQVDVQNTFGFNGSHLQPFNQGTFFKRS